MRRILITFGLIISSLSTHAASVTFQTVYLGLNTFNSINYTYDTNTQSIVLGSQTPTAIVGLAFKFTSANPADVTFSGNNLAGQFSYSQNGQLYKFNGVISRKASTNGVDNAYYFYETTVLGGASSTGRAWLMVIPGREAALTSSIGTKTPFDVSTNSAGVGTGLETLRLAEAGLTDPIITSDGGGSIAAISIAENSTSVTTVTGTVYAQTTIGSVTYPASTKTFSISGGVDAAKFTINSTTGALTFITAPNYENPTDIGLNNVYDVVVTLTDSQGTTDTQSIAVTVTNLNDAPPVITSNGGGTTATIPVLVGATTVTTVKATDADYGDVLTYSISGGANAGLFDINPSSGALTFKTAAVGGSYEVIVTVTDANNPAHTDTQTLTVNVSATDTSAPSVVITSSDANLSAGESCTISFQFSELVQGFTIGDVAFTGGNLTGLTQSITDPTLYTATFTQSGTSVPAPTFNIAAGTYQDMASPTPNNGTAATQLTLAADWTPPTVAVSFSSTTISTGESKIVTFTFSENPGNSFLTSDITITNATLSGLTQTADPKVWIATIVSTSSRYSPVVTVLNNSYTDLAGNLGSSGTNTLRLIPPSIDLSNDPVSDTGISSSDNITTKRNPIIAGKNNDALAFTSVLVQYYVGATLTTLTYTTGTGITYTAADSTFTIDLSIATPTTGTWPSGGLPEGYVTLNLTTSTSALASNSFLIDLTAPTPIPVVNAITPAYDATPTIYGTATVLDGETLRVAVNGVTYTNGDGYLSLNGTDWTLVIPVANKIPAGTYSVTASVTDAAGNVSTDATSNELVIYASTLTVDLKNDATNDTGVSSTDNITTNRSPIITGSSVGSDGSVKVTILSGGVTYIYNSVSVTSNAFTLDLAAVTPSSIVPTGSFPSAGLPAGTVSLTVEGNTSGAIGTNSFTIEELQTSNIIATPTFTTVQISWTKGTRASRVVFMKEGTGAITNPTNFTTYSASSNWNNKGTQAGTSGYYCIYNGSHENGSVLVTNLYPGLTYTIQAFEYEGNLYNENYLTSLSGTNNPTTVVPWPSTTFTNSSGVSTPEAWTTSARWNHDTIPSANLHPAVTIYIDGNCQVTDTAVAHNLTILAPHDLVVPKVTVLPEKLLQITGNLSGQLINNGNAAALVIKADETKANGSLIFASGSPQATVEMYSKAWWNLNEVINSKYNWQFMTIPVQNISDVTSVFDGGYVRVHNEAGWGAGLGDVPLKRWTQLPNGASMQYDKCYEIVQPTPRFYTFTGTLFNGNINRSLSYTPKITNVQGEYPGQHLIGNPYTTAIDITQIQFGANMEETVYIYNTGTFNSWGNNKAASGTNPGQYVAIPKNIASQTTPIGLQRQIPSMQAFLVKCTTASTIDISYNTAKTKNTETQRISHTPALPWLRIELKGATKGGDMLWLFKKDGTSREFDNGWDGYKINGDIGMPRIFDSELISNYQINTMPDFNETKLGFRAGNGDTQYTLSFDNYNLSETYAELYLLDKNTNQLVDIRNKCEYSFTATNTTTTEERFKILTYRPVSTSNTVIKANVFYIDSRLTFQNFADQHTKFYLYDINGRKILETKIQRGETRIVDLKLIPGIYICSVLSNNQYTKKTVIVK